MKILVTGGAGFIGSHIVDAYCNLGHEVVALDDLSTGHAENVSRSARLVQLDVRDPALDHLFEVEQFDVVSHQAAKGNVRGSIEQPTVYADVNLTGGVHVLDCCRRFGVKKVIYASTGGCVYGEPLYVPSDEGHPMTPRDPYGASKAGFELFLPVFAANYGLKFTIFRYPNVYGPRQDPYGEAGVVSIFAGQMLLGQAPVINGDGQQERDYVFVADVARANVLALSGGDNEVFNLGWGVGVSVNAIFRSLCIFLRKDLEESHGPPKQGEVRRSILDSAKADRLLGWRPTVHLDEGLAKTVEFVKMQLNAGWGSELHAQAPRTSKDS